MSMMALIMILFLMGRLNTINSPTALSPPATAAPLRRSIVYRLYGAALGRVPDNSGLKNWIAAIDSGTLTLKQAVSGFTSSTEFLNRYGNPDNTTFVTLLYKNVLGRTPDSGGLAAWTNALSAGMSRSDAVLGFSESAEDMEKTRATIEKGLWLSDDQAAQVARLYHATLNRLPEAGGLENWTAALKSGATLLQITDGFTGSAEFQQKYGSLNNTGFVTLLYGNVEKRYLIQVAAHNLGLVIRHRFGAGTPRQAAALFGLVSDECQGRGLAIWTILVPSCADQRTTAGVSPVVLIYLLVFSEPV